MRKWRCQKMESESTAVGLSAPFNTENLLMNFQRVSYYLLLLGVALRIPAKLQNGYDDSHGQPAQQDNKHAACCRFQT